MSAHTRPDDTPLYLPGLGLPDATHEALAALSHAADAACSRAGFGCSRSEALADLDAVAEALARAREAVGNPVDKSGGP